MKISILVIVCTAFALAAGFAGQVAAASLSTAYSVAALYQTCYASGEGSGSITEQSTGCPEVITDGSFRVSGSGQASYDTLRATALIGFSDVAPRYNLGTDLATASGGARYQDRITIDSPGRTGEIVDLVFNTAMNGMMTASADYDSVYGQVNASLQVDVNGTNVVVSRNAKSHGTPSDNDFNPGRVQITLGTPFSVNALLQVNAWLDPTGYGPYSGDVLADLANSAGITSFELFETGSETAITNWNLTSESGEFGFYSVVPIPASGWLFGSGLLGLVGMARIKRTV